MEDQQNNLNNTQTVELALTFDTKLHKKQLSAHQTQLKRRPGINAQRIKYYYKIKQPVAMETKRRTFQRNNDNLIEVLGIAISLAFGRGVTQLLREIPKSAANSPELSQNGHERNFNNRDPLHSTVEMCLIF